MAVSVLLSLDSTCLGSATAKTSPWLLPHMADPATHIFKLMQQVAMRHAICIYSSPPIVDSSCSGSANAKTSPWLSPHTTSPAVGSAAREMMRGLLRRWNGDCAVASREGASWPAHMLEAHC